MYSNGTVLCTEYTNCKHDRQEYFIGAKFGKLTIFFLSAFLAAAELLGDNLDP